MNIWIVSDGEPLPIDGENVRVRRMGMLSEILQSRGHEIHWFSSTFHHYKKTHRSENTETVVVKEDYFIELLKTNGYSKNVSYQRLRNYKELKLKFLAEAEKKKKPDIILATLAPLELSTAATEYGEKYDIPVIIDVRDLWPDVFREVLPNSLSWITELYISYCKRKLKKTLNKVDNIVAVTPYFLDYGLKIAKRDKKETDRVFYTSYKPFEYDNISFESEWKEFNLKEDDFIVVFLGNFGKQFLLEPVLESAINLEKYKKIKFVLCGVGENLEKFKEKYESFDNIIFPGWIDKSKISTLMLNANVGVAPYKNSINFTKNAPNKFGEYLSASLPILVGVEGIMEDLLIEHNCGMKYGKTEDLTNKILDLYENPGRLNEMSVNALKLFDEKFNAERVYLDFAMYLEKISEKESE